MSAERESFIVVLRPEPHVDGLCALRAALRVLLRRHGLRCIRITTAPPGDAGAHPTPVRGDSGAERVANEMPGHE